MSCLRFGAVQAWSKILKQSCCRRPHNPSRRVNKEKFVEEQGWRLQDIPMIWPDSILLQGLEAALILLALQTLKVYVRWRTSPLQKLPGPRNTFFLTGEFFNIFRAPFFENHMKWFEQYNYPPVISYYSLFGIWNVIPTDPEIIKHIMTSPSAQEPVRYYKNFKFFVDMVGDGLVSLEGQTWSRHRRILQPCFQTTKIKSALMSSVPSKVSSLIDSWKRSQGREINIYKHMSAITLDILGEVALSHDFHALDTVTTWSNDTSLEAEMGELEDPMMRALGKIFTPSKISVMLALLKMSWVQSYLFPSRNRTRELLDEAADGVLQRAQNNPPKSKDAQSLIHNLLSANDAEGRNSLSVQEIRDEIKLFIIAGHETTSTLCYWAFYALGKHPDVQQKVLDDILKHSPANRQIDLDEINNMQYFLAFLQETLRLYSPAGWIFRFPNSDETWKGCLIPKKTRIIIPIFLLHRHPDYWADPDKFLPERWLESNGPKAPKHPFCFMPFSAGGRNCIGEKFARFKAQLILANLIRNFDVKLAPSIRDQKLEFRSSLTIKSKPRVKIVVKPRE